MHSKFLNFKLFHSKFFFYSKIFRKKKKNQENKWNQKMELLHVFKEIYGHSNVPQRYQHDSCLGAWVGKQRCYYYKLKISEKRIKLLNFLKFEWSPGKCFFFGSIWKRRFEELKYFKNIHGHCNVPCNYFNNKELGNWVKNQRQFFKKKILEKNRISLLNDLGFEWIRRETPLKLSWNERYKELKNYIACFGNGMVPQRCGALGKWVQKQRDLFRKNKIKNERKELLSSINFIWNPRNIISKKKEGPVINYLNRENFFLKNNKIDTEIFSLFSSFYNI
jgi:hypothetical protein